MKSFSLQNAEKLAKEYKYTFYRPSVENIKKVVPGECVQLIFNFESDNPKDPSAERMWVEVDKLDGNGNFSGKLKNTPKYIKDLKYDDFVSFKDIHIIQTEHSEEDGENNLVNKYMVRCYVTRRVLYEGHLVGYLMRYETESENESGWCLMAGDESEDYMENVNNICYVSLGAVLNEDDGFIHLLDSPIGSEYEWDDKIEGFVLIQ